MNRSDPALREQVAVLLPRLRRFARTLTRHAADADDLVQVTVERALVRLDQWQPDTRLESWMFKIMKNAWIDEVRARVRRARVLAPEEAGVNVGDCSADAQMTAMSVEAAMALLPEEQRIAVALVLVEGLSYKEAAAVAEIPTGTLTSRLARGREALTRMLSDGGGAS